MNDREEAGHGYWASGQARWRTTQNIENILQQRANGQSLKSIGREYGVSGTSVWRLLQEA